MWEAMKNGRLWPWGFVALTLAIGTVEPLSGQENAAEVIVAVAERFPEFGTAGPVHNRVAIILRVPGDHDIVLLDPTHATPVALRAALADLERSRLEARIPERPMLLEIRMAPQRGAPPEMRALADVLQVVRQQPTVRIANFARGKAAQFSPAHLGIE